MTIWSDTAPTQPGWYWVRIKDADDCQPGYFDGVNWFFIWPYQDWFPSDNPDAYQFGPRIPTPEELHDLNRLAAVARYALESWGMTWDEYKQKGSPCLDG